MSTAATGDDGDGPNALAESMIGALDRPQQASMETFEERGPDVWLPRLDLPGFGEAYGHDHDGGACGEDIPHFCEDCGHSFAVGRTCKRSVCPRCAPAWVLDRAPGIVARLDTIARVKSSRADEAVYKHHVVLSPPDDWALEAEDVLDRSFKVIRDLLSTWNAEGAVFYHPWSGKEGLDGDDRGEWKKRLFNDRDWEGDVRNELTSRGHFHAIVAAEHIPGGETISQVHDRTGWVIKRVTKRDGSGRSLEDLEDVARATSYSMSHVGIDTEREGHNSAAYRKFGATWHDSSIDVYDSTKEAADQAVREVAPQTLGIPAKSVRCGREVSESARDEVFRDRFSKPSGGDLEDTPEVDDLDPEPGSSTIEVEASDLEDDELVPCGGGVIHMKDAPRYLRDRSWWASASKSEQLLEKYREWLSGNDPPPE